MGDVALVTVVDAAVVGVCDVPRGAGEVLFPVLDAVVVLVTGVLTARRVGLTGIDDAVAVRVLFTVVKGVVVGVVVAWVARLCGLTVGAVDLNAVAQAVTVGIEGGRVGQEGQRFVGIVQAVAVRVRVGRVRRGDAVHFSGQRRAATRTNAAHRVTRGDGLGGGAGFRSETGRRTAVGRP